MFTKQTITRKSIDELSRVCPGVTLPSVAQYTLYGQGNGTQGDPFTWDEFLDFMDSDYSSRFPSGSGAIYYINRSGNLEGAIMIGTVEVVRPRPGGGSGNSGNNENELKPEQDDVSGNKPEPKPERPDDDTNPHPPVGGGGGSSTTTTTENEDPDPDPKKDPHEDENQDKKTEKEKYDEMIEKFFGTPNDCVFKYLAYDWRYWMKGAAVGFDYEADFKKKFGYNGYADGVNTQDVLPFLQMYYNVATFLSDKVDYSLKAAQAKGLKTMVVVKKMDNGKEILHAMALDGFKDNKLICIDTAYLHKTEELTIDKMVIAYSLQPKKSWMPKDN